MALNLLSVVFPIAALVSISTNEMNGGSNFVYTLSATTFADFNAMERHRKYHCAISSMNKRAVINRIKNHVLVLSSYSLSLPPPACGGRFSGGPVGRKGAK